MWFTKSLLFVILSFETLVNSQDDYYGVSEKREGTKYCGRNLANALQLVCGGIYNSMFSKKSDPGVDMDWLRDLEILEPTEELGYQLFRPRMHAQALLSPNGSFKRHTRGAYDECCLKSCSVKEMSGYCATRA
ncbi:LIRP-like [Lycorma delicatula]|uniref:LIRP-like n=1 Tax=Lycorma delicatula TaxID=130591 RepID=UPI003F50ED55